MPLEVARLRKSKAWLLAKKRPELAFYMVNLWTAAWHEVPAGSIEDDDEVLADAAMCSPLTRWKSVRETALRGWVKCSDGRLYHPIVAEKAREAWAAKVEQRRRTAAATAARNASRETQRNVVRDVPRNVLRDDQRNGERDDNATFTKGREGKGISKPSVVETPTVEAPKAHNASLKKDNGKSTARWDESDEGIDAKGRELGMSARPGETYFDFKHRLWQEINAKSRHAQ
jgi:hypothetical protein